MKNIAHDGFQLARAALLGAGALGLLQVAIGCGRVKMDDTGSETHWLARCDSDLDCMEGSCVCGVCSRPCDAVSDCSELGVAGVQCTRDSTSCETGATAQGGTATAVSGNACLSPCTRDDDCGQLGDSAVCREQRCELPKAAIDSDGLGGQGNATGGSAGASGTAGDGSVGGQGGSGEAEIATLCDGSDDVRLTYVVDGGFVGLYYEFFSNIYGHASFVIDGQCRFWETRASNGWVYTGTLDADSAQDFAESIGYGHLSDYSAFDDPQCPDGTLSTLAAPEGRIRCTCACTNNPDAPAGWLQAFRAVSNRGALFANGETVTSPAQLALHPPATLSPNYTPEVWPLESVPPQNAFVPNDGSGSVFLTAASGALIIDMAELAAVRQMRANFAAAQMPGSSLAFVPVMELRPESIGSFDMFLRDEVPEKVRAALASAAQ